MRPLTVAFLLLLALGSIASCGDDKSRPIAVEAIPPPPDTGPAPEYDRSGRIVRWPGHNEDEVDHKNREREDAGLIRR